MKSLIGIILGFLLMNFALFSCSPSSKKFEDIGYWKENQNRVFTVFSADTNWTEIRRYADRQMHTSGRNTVIFFFDRKDKTPYVTTLKYKTVSGVVDYIYDRGHIEFCTVQYWKYPNGSVNFEKNPRRQK